MHWTWSWLSVSATCGLLANILLSVVAYRREVGPLAWPYQDVVPLWYLQRFGEPPVGRIPPSHWSALLSYRRARGRRAGLMTLAGALPWAGAIVVAARPGTLMENVLSGVLVAVGSAWLLAFLPGSELARREASRTAPATEAVRRGTQDAKAPSPRSPLVASSRLRSTPPPEILRDPASLASDRSLRCARCAKQPLLKKTDIVESGPVGFRGSLSDMMQWQKDLQKIADATAHMRAVRCSACGRIYCFQCGMSQGRILSGGARGCLECGAPLDIVT